MRQILRSSLLVLLILCGPVRWLALVPALAASPSATPAGPPTAAMNAAELRQLIDTLNDPVRRATLITTLETLRKAAPPAAVSTPLPTAAPAATQPAASPASVVALRPDSLGAQLIARGVGLADTVSGSFLLAVRGIADLPDLLRWLRGVGQDPDMLLIGAISAGRLLCVILLALAGELLVWRLTYRFYKGLAADAHRQDGEALATDPPPATTHEPDPIDEAPSADELQHTDAPPATAASKDGWLLLRRLPFILMAATVDVLPPLAFLAVATLLLGTPLTGSSGVRTVTIAVVDAYVIVRIIGCVARASFGAPAARLRLLPVSNDAARDLMLWERRIAIVIVFGYALSQLALLFGMDSDTQQGVLRLISLLVHLMLIALVLRSRTRVAAALAGSGEGRLHGLRHLLASVWHVYAIIVIIGAWIIYAAAINDGFEHLIHFMLSTIVVGLAARVADIVLVGALDRGFAVAGDDSSRYARIEARVARYHNPTRVLLRAMIGAVAIVALLQVWGLDALDWFGRGALGGRLASSAVTLILTLAVAIALWEAVNVAMQVYLDDLGRQGAAIRAARLRTIVPLLRNTLLIMLLVLIVLTAMSEVGVNIGPLLAGASIFGVAIGFGSQKLVQDFITGIFLLIENAMQVGDWVTAAGLSGTVENLSIRTLRLRAGDGSVHLIPFSSVSTVTNTNRGLGNAAVSITVDYEEDTARVATVLARIVTEMRSEEAFANGMLSDLQLWGVDHVDGATVTLAGQIACTDAARWGVQREFNRRVKLAFQEAGIRMMPPVTLMGFRHPLDIRLERPAEAPRRPRETAREIHPAEAADG
jgi:small-conductance mechanosensitive channel